MKRFCRPLRARALALLAAALVLATVLTGCSARPFSTHATSTSTNPSSPSETWVAITSASTTAPPKKPTSTSAWRSTSTTTRPSTTSTTRELHPTTGNAATVAAKVKTSVVLVRAITETNTTGYYELEGTGVVCRTSGSYAYIVTSNHVIERDNGKAAKRIRVALPTGSTVSATLIGREPTADIAVLRVKSKRVTAASFRTDLSQLREDDFVVAVGKPKQLDDPVVGGNVLGYYKDIEYPDPALTGVHAVIETTAPLEKGFSGGPLLDYQGRVIGINMARFLDEPGGISLPADFVVEVVERLMGAAGWSEPATVGQAGWFACPGPALAFEPALGPARKALQSAAVCLL